MSFQTEKKYCTFGMSAKALIHQGDWADCLLMSLCHVRMLECFPHALFLPPTPPLEIVLSRTGVVRPAHRPKRGRTYFHLHFHPKITGLSALSRRGTFRILEYRIDILYIPCLTTEGKTPICGLMQWATYRNSKELSLSRISAVRMKTLTLIF